MSRARASRFSRVTSSTAVSGARGDGAEEGLPGALQYAEDGRGAVQGIKYRALEERRCGLVRAQLVHQYQAAAPAAAQRGAAQRLEAEGHVRPRRGAGEEQVPLAGLLAAGHAQQVDGGLPGAHCIDPHRSEAAHAPGEAGEQPVDERGFADALFAGEEEVPRRHMSPRKNSMRGERARTSHSRRP